MIGQMFVQIHSDPACSRMHGHFAAAYMAASIERKMPMADRPAAMAAFA